MDVKEYQSLLDKIDILQDIQLAEKQIDEGKGLDHKKVKKILLDKFSKNRLKLFYSVALYVLLNKVMVGICRAKKNGPKTPSSRADPEPITTFIT